MLLATPFLHIDNVLVKDEPPRIISEVKKSQIGLCREQQSRPRLSADLFVRFGNEQQWWPRKVAIIGGQLLVSNIHGESKYGSVRIPLRRFSLSAGKLANSLSLIRGQNILLTIQTPNEKSFDIWVKTIAIELIRQTPLEDVKYFDILTIDDSWKRKSTEDERRDLNFNRIQQPQHCTSCNAETATTHVKYENYPKTLVEATPAPSNRYKRNVSSLKNGINYTTQRSQVYHHHRNIEKVPLRARSRSCNSVSKHDINSNYIGKPQMAVTFDDASKDTRDENTIEVLLKKCQNHENYVPVKEKLLLFETLCRLGRNVRSTEDMHLKVDMVTAKRARSLHDLHSISSAGVRRICRYFEDKCESTNDVKKDKRLIHSDSNLNNIRFQGHRSPAYNVGYA